MAEIYPIKQLSIQGQLWTKCILTGILPSADENEAAACRLPLCSFRPPGEDLSTCTGTCASTHKDARAQTIQERKS